DGTALEVQEPVGASAGAEKESSSPKPCPTNRSGWKGLAMGSGGSGLAPIRLAGSTSERCRSVISTNPPGQSAKTARWKCRSATQTLENADAFPTFPPPRRRVSSQSRQKNSNGLKCYLCARSQVLPMCPAGQPPVGFGTMRL